MRKANGYHESKENRGTARNAIERPYNVRNVGKSSKEMERKARYVRQNCSARLRAERGAFAGAIRVSNNGAHPGMYKVWGRAREQAMHKTAQGIQGLV
jgi:hypothetical protein